jgi:PAS domain S-box-containing protein
MITILFIDDEEAIRGLVKTYLELSGDLIVDLAPSAEAGIEMMKETIYDAIVCDYEMPGGMDGIAFLQYLREGGNPIPFLLFTGKGQEEVAINAINIGADFYIQKGGTTRAQFTDLIQKVGQAVQRRRTEDALRESERNYRSLVENLPDIVLTTDRNGDIVTLNSTGTGVLNLQPDPMLHQPWTFILEPEDSNMADDAFNAMIRGEGPVQDLPATLTPSVEGADAIPVMISGRVLTDEGGSVTGARLIIRDLSRFFAATEELRETSEELTVLLALLPLPVITLDTQGMVQRWNPGATGLFGWRSNEAAGKFLPVIPMEKTTEFKKILSRSLQAAGVYDFPFRARKKDGSAIDLLLSVSPLHDRRGKPSSILLVAREGKK